jgi:hypothetical protein
VNGGCTCGESRVDLAECDKLGDAVCERTKGILNQSYFVEQVQLADATGVSRYQAKRQEVLGFACHCNGMAYFALDFVGDRETGSSESTVSAHWLCWRVGRLCLQVIVGWNPDVLGMEVGSLCLSGVVGWNACVSFVHL